MAGFNKFLIVSTETSHLEHEKFHLDRIAWPDLVQIKNLSDFDGVVINLTALAEHKQLKVLNLSGIATLFDLTSWTQIVSSGGGIYIVGDPDSTVSVLDTSTKLTGPMLSSTPGPSKPLRQNLVRRIKLLAGRLDIEKDLRPLEYRRVDRPNEFGTKNIYRYLDSVTDWKYSLSQWRIADEWDRVLGDNVTALPGPLGMTSYSTALAVFYQFVTPHQQSGHLVLLPSSGRGSEAEDVFILQELFGIATSLPEPKWVQKLQVPAQAEIENGIATKHEALRTLQGEILSDKDRLKSCKRWYRLLYDDGRSLEEIVKEGLELLGASVTKVSKEKEDYRVKVPGFAEGVMEVKGTHNRKFGIGALRQLGGWMDDVIAKERINVKGIFVGNAARNDEPQSRGSLFEKNSEDYARVKEALILRTMDLFCFTILKQLSKLDVADLWKALYLAKGCFDATPYWSDLPPEFQIGVQRQSSDERKRSETVSATTLPECPSDYSDGNHGDRQPNAQAPSGNEPQKKSGNSTRRQKAGVESLPLTGDTSKEVHEKVLKPGPHKS
jgi:hypothetical protein